MRLWVSDLDRMLEFYGHLLGFEITHRVGRSLAFLSAGGFHPQIVLIARDADGGAPAARFALRFPDRDALAATFQAISGAALPLDRSIDDGVRESLYLRDPDGNDVELYYDRPRDQWRLDADGTPRILSQPVDLDSLRAAGERAVAASAAADAARPVSSLTGTTRQRLGDVRARLLNLHKVLLDDAKTAYEMDRGRVGSSASLLQLVISDPWFAWLHPLSELVVRIDETLQPDAPATEADGVALLEQVERLLSPSEATEEFAARYYEALQRQPAVIVAHAEVRRILKQAR